MPEQRKTLVIDQPELLFKVSTRRSFLKLLGVGGSIVLMPSVFAACNDSDRPHRYREQPRSQRHTRSDERHRHSELRLRARAARGGVLHRRRRVGSVLVDERRAAGSDDRPAQPRGHPSRVPQGGARRERDRHRCRSTPRRSRRLLTDGPTILKNAEMFEDLGVSAYNGAGKYLTSATNLTLAGKIVSVEARHAAAIRDIRDALGIRGTATLRTRALPAIPSSTRRVSTSSSSRASCSARSSPPIS